MPLTGLSLGNRAEWAGVARAISLDVHSGLPGLRSLRVRCASTARSRGGGSGHAPSDGSRQSPAHFRRSANAQSPPAPPPRALDARPRARLTTRDHPVLEFHSVYRVTSGISWVVAVGK